MKESTALFSFAVLLTITLVPYIAAWGECSKPAVHSDASSLPNSPEGIEKRYQLFQTIFEPTSIKENAARTPVYRFSCWGKASKAYTVTLVEGPEDLILSQIFLIDDKKGFPVWIKSEQVKTRSVKKEEMKELVTLLSAAFKENERMATHGIAGHFWLEETNGSESSVMNLYGMRFDGENKFLKKISKYVPYLPEMPVEYYADKSGKL